MDRSRGLAVFLMESFFAATSVIAVVTLVNTTDCEGSRKYKRNTQPIKTMTHVMVVKTCEVSGSTIGYHGTAIRVIDRSVLRNLDTPANWSYRVFIPVLEAQFEIVASNIISTGEMDDSGTLLHVLRDIQFDFESSEESHGAYRLKENDWLHFHFKKHDESHDECTMGIPMIAEFPVTRRLYNLVRRETILDRAYVLRALEAILCSHRNIPCSRVRRGLPEAIQDRPSEANQGASPSHLVLSQLVGIRRVFDSQRVVKRFLLPTEKDSRCGIIRKDQIHFESLMRLFANT